MENINELSVANMAEKITARLEEEFKKMGSCNVMIAGKTGAGKSTLINAVFGENRVKTGIGKHVTTEIKKIVANDGSLVIYDTPGLELGGNFSIQKLLSEIKELTNDKLAEGDIKEAVHFIWYCISVPSNRVEQSELEFIKDIARESNVPVFVVLTQAYNNESTDELKKLIENEKISEVKAVIPVLAVDFHINDGYTIPSYGLDKLIETTMSFLSEAHRNALIAVQRYDLKLKEEKATDVVYVSAAAAAATGMIPIPFSDAPVLVAEQITMIAKITGIYGFKISKNVISAIVSATVGTAGATVLGKTVVSSILKFIPGAGSLIGGAISGATAAAITASLGEAYIKIMTKIFNGSIPEEELLTEAGKKKIADEFKKQLSTKRDNEGKPV